MDFLESIDVKARAKLLARIEAIEIHGIEIATRMQWVKKLEYNLFEIRVQLSGNQYRSLYFQSTGNQYVITHGFSKKTQKTPKQEIIHARHMRDTWQGNPQ
ncbi:type II toxin-antitoxin system RelE/ParE family toxin [Bifidobacterium oedipodis]|nr:type II toxin-antitoxin system RelE/ParE family toxin [Bifidobacterium sp. DSM 109957]